jgi:cellulose synthase/poly-beta-1,6-N-acetylglucosamine synthase-like glycosyltransferase
MISTALYTIFYAFGFVIFLLGLQGIIFFPLTILYEIWKKRALKKLPSFSAKVSILIPAYNEEKTIRQTILSILESAYPDKEIIVINDGSTDNTEHEIRDLIKSGRIVYIKKSNGGKASALNVGIDAATGEVIIFTDADSKACIQSCALNAF